MENTNTAGVTNEQINSGGWLLLPLSAAEKARLTELSISRPLPRNEAVDTRLVSLGLVEPFSYRGTTLTEFSQEYDFTSDDPDFWPTLGEFHPHSAAGCGGDPETDCPICEALKAGPPAEPAEPAEPAVSVEVVKPAVPHFIPADFIVRANDRYTDARVILSRDKYGTLEVNLPQDSGYLVDFGAEVQVNRQDDEGNPIDWCTYIFAEGARRDEIDNRQSGQEARTFTSEADALSAISRILRYEIKDQIGELQSRLEELDRIDAVLATTVATVGEVPA